MPVIVRTITVGCVALVCGLNSAFGALIAVDIGVADPASFPGASPNQVQSGFFDFSVAGDSSLYNEDRRVFGLGTASRTFAGIEVQIRGTINGAVYRDFATEISHPMGDLLEDGVDVYGELFVTLKNVPTGLYSLQTWHHRTDTFNTAPMFDIFADVGNGEVLVADDVVGSVGSSPAQFSTVNFVVQATSGTDVQLRFVGANTVFLNGFEMTAAVPEPSAVWLAAAAMLAIGCTWLRRKPLPAFEPSVG